MKVAFGSMHIGQMFTLNGNTYVKQSSRTGRYCANGRIFYIGKMESVEPERAKTSYLLTETVTTTFECVATSRIDALNQLLYAKQGDGEGITCTGVDVDWGDDEGKPEELSDVAVRARYAALMSAIARATQIADKSNKIDREKAIGVAVSRAMGEWS